MNNTASKNHIRGSSLLLGGRLIALSLNFFTQILTVRYLTVSDYGSYAYALAMAVYAASLVAFGLDYAVARFMPIYRQQKRYAEMFGAFFFMLATILAIGCLLVITTYALYPLILMQWAQAPLTAVLLLIFVHFVPLLAIDRYLEASMAVFAGPMAIFIRRHIVGPILKLLAILYVINVSGSPQSLAKLIVGIGVIGISIYFLMLLHAWNKDGLLNKLKTNGLSVTPKPLLTFSLPSFGVELNTVLQSAVVIIVLGSLHQELGIAAYQVVIPMAELNYLVSRIFSTLYIPLAAKCYAKRETEQINRLYWDSFTWIAILSFPIMALCLAMPEQLISLLYGSKYLESAPVLTYLSIAYYFHALLSLNSKTLKVFNKVRPLLITETLSTILSLVLCVLLIPAWGAKGAALTIAISTVIRNLANQWLMLKYTSVDTSTPGIKRLLASLLVCSVTLAAIGSRPSAGFGLPFATVIVSSFIIFYLNRRSMNIVTMFPEIADKPILRKLFFSAHKP